MTTGACVLRSGGVYKPEHVAILAHMLESKARFDRFVCLTDMAVDVPGVERVPLKHDWPGWWSKIEMLANGIFPDGEKVLYSDLDVIITGSMQDIADRPEPWIVLEDFYRPGHYGSGLMMFTAGEQFEVYRQFARDPERCMTAAGFHGDQAHIERLAPNAAFWQTLLPGQAVSYKTGCGGGVGRPAIIPPNARIVAFHGRPRPWQVSDPWVKQLWRAL